MRPSFVAGVVVVSFAVAICLLLGTIGWFAVGFGVMTTCTNDYSCTATGCGPCATTGRWIDVGGVSQLVLAVLGVAVLVRHRHTDRGGRLALYGAGLLAASVLTIVGTTQLAEHSYCRPGTAGYARSYCSVEP